MDILKKIRGDNRGTVAMIAGMLAPLLVGGLAIIVDASYWRYRATNLQVAADMTTISLAIDLSNGINNSSVLTTNARNEARKNGCTTSCTVTVTYPYNSNASAVNVVIVDPNASRFFSFLYGTSSKILTAAASGQIATGGGGSGVSHGGSGCILAAAATPPSGSGRGVEVQGATTIIEGCEVISNATGSSSVFGDANGRINARVTAVGQFQMMNGSSVTVARPNQPTTPDPYSSFYQNNNATNPLRKAQFDGTYAAPSAIQGKCMENVVSGNINGPNWADDQQADWANGGVSNKLYNPSSRGYSTSIGSDGRRIHNLNGGGGVFCADFSASNVVMNFGPGAWYFMRDMSLSNVTINAMTSGTTVTIPSTIPSIGGAPTNGTTFILSNYNWTLGNTSEMHVRAPTSGPLAGMALTSYQDSGMTNLFMEFSNSSIFEMAGLMYLPQRYVRVQNNGNFSSVAGTDGTSETGCSQIVVGSFSVLNDTTIRNNCGGYGVQPFGTDTTTGWYTSGGSGSSIKGRLIN